MADAVLWTLEEAGRAMAVSPRTVRRLQETGELPVVYVGRARRVPAESVREWVTGQMTLTHTQYCAGLGVPAKGGNGTCRSASKAGTRTVSTSAGTPPTGGPPSSMRAARELAAVLELPTGGKRRRS